jgi:hypothetical protein
VHQLQITPVAEAAFEAEARLEAREILVRFAGAADLTVKARMDSFLLAVHEEAVRLDIDLVNVDISGLEFMNSSCLMAIATWIASIQAIARRYHVAFHFKAVRSWHRRSLDAITELGGGVVSVNPVERKAPQPADEAKDTTDEATRVVRPPLQRG